MTLVEILLASHRSARRRQRGCRALYLALLLALSGGPLFLLSALVMPWSTCACTPKPKQAEYDTANFARAVEQFKLQYDRCPARIGELKAITVHTRHLRDPWGRQFVIGCAPDEVLVCSLGREVLDVAPLEQHGGEGGDDCHHEHHGVPREAARIEHCERPAERRDENAAVEKRRGARAGGHD